MAWGPKVHQAAKPLAWRMTYKRVVLHSGVRLNLQVSCGHLSWPSSEILAGPGQDNRVEFGAVLKGPAILGSLLKKDTHPFR